MCARLTALVLAFVYYKITSLESGQAAAVFDHTTFFWNGFIAIFVALLVGLCFRLMQSQQMGWEFWIDQLIFTFPALLLAHRFTGWTITGLAVLSIILAISFGFAIFFRRWNSQINFGRWILIGSLMFVVTVHVLVRQDMVAFSRQLGAVNLVFIFLSLVALLVLCALKRPWIGLPILTLTIASFLLNDLSHDIERKNTGIGENVPPPLQATFQSWLLSRNDLGDYLSAKKPYPVILIAAEGGGGYAAAHAYVFLTKLQQRCPNFIQHTFALIGVSGGAVGNTRFHAGLGGKLNHDSVKGCSEVQNPDSIIEKLHHDHLSPVIAALLFIDAPNKVLAGALGTYDRSDALAASLTMDSVQSDDGLGGDFLSHYWDQKLLPNYRLRDGPALVHVATNAVSGMRYIFAPFIIGNESPGNRRHEEAFRDLMRFGGEAADIRMIDAAIASASFPWVTPSLELSVDDRSSVQLVDGGYLDNSGTETLADVLADIMDINVFGAGMPQVDISAPQSHSETLPIHNCENPTIKYVGPIGSVGERLTQLQLDNESLQEEIEWLAVGDEHSASRELREEAIEHEECVVSFTVYSIILHAEAPQERFSEEQNFFLDPVTALLNTRQRRGETARYRLLSALCGSPVCGYPQGGDASEWQYLESVIDPQFLTLPLGWDIPKHSLEAIIRSVVSKEIDAPDHDCEDEESYCPPGSDYNSPFGGMEANPANIEMLLDIFQRPVQ